MRLGTRVATMPAEDTTVEQLVGAMTGALDATPADADADADEGGCPVTTTEPAVDRSETR